MVSGGLPVPPGRVRARGGLLRRGVLGSRPGIPGRARLLCGLSGVSAPVPYEQNPIAISHIARRPPPPGLAMTLQCVFFY